MNAENISSRYSDVVITDGEPINPHDKDSAFYSMCDFPDKDIKFPEWSYVLNCCSEFSGVFVPDSEMNDDEDTDLPFIIFYHYGNISSCYFHKHLLIEHGKTFPLCIILENSKKGKVKTRKSLVIKSCNILYFYSEYYIPEIGNLAFFCQMFTSLGRIIIQVKCMTCL